MNKNDIDIDFVNLEPDWKDAVFDNSKALRRNLGEKLKKIFAARPPAPLPARVARLAVFGSRTLAGPRVVEVIDTYALKLSPDLLVTAGEPAGVCRTAQEYARAHCRPCRCIF